MGDGEKGIERGCHKYQEVQRLVVSSPLKELSFVASWLR
jgi:hypothetical protein